MIWIGLYFFPQISCQLYFANCIFINKKTDFEGETLSIQVIEDCKISNYQFINNDANQKTDSPDALRLVGGSAIFIDSDFLYQTENQKLPLIYASLTIISVQMVML